MNLTEEQFVEFALVLNFQLANLNRSHGCVVGIAAVEVLQIDEHLIQTISVLNAENVVIMLMTVRNMAEEEVDEDHTLDHVHVVLATEAMIVAEAVTVTDPVRDILV